MSVHVFSVVAKVVKGHDKIPSCPVREFAIEALARMGR
jgi:hypothetical protein